MKSQSNQKKCYLFWLDENVYKNNNMSNLKAFKELISLRKLQVDFKEMNSKEVFKYELSKLSKNYFVIVICSASLPVPWYQWMQQQQKIKMIGLFCLSQQGADLLARNQFIKIKNQSMSCQKVLQFVRQQIQIHQKQ